MTDDFRAALVAEARTWVGTPKHWQQSVKGRGTDCKGWIVETARAVGRPEAETAEAAMIGDHHHRVPVVELRRALRKLFDRATEARPGDILLLKTYRAKANHLAMYVGNNRMIHCYGKAGLGVIEVPMGKVWWSALDSIWTWRV